MIHRLARIFMHKQACRSLVLAGMLALPAAPAVAEAPKLGLPIDCRFGFNCFIQQYADTDPGPKATDFRGGLLSYQNHSGTDFALMTLHQMRVGVPVIASADGRVVGVRNNMEDGVFAKHGPAAIAGKDCGNGVRLDHGDGWQTQYCHLRKGSVTLRAGQLVRAGEPMGLVGMSGRAQFPHVHLSVLQDGQKIDPFTGKALTGTCNRADCNKPLWRASTARTLAYRPGGLIDSGFSDATITYDKIKDGTAKQGRMTARAGAITIFAYGYGVRVGDTLTMEIQPPGGAAPWTWKYNLEKNQAQFARWFGRRAPASGWKPGLYQGKARLIRRGKVIQSRQSRLLIR